VAKPYDIPVKILVKVGDSEPVEVATGVFRWPYTDSVELERLFRSAADQLAVDNG